MTLHAGGYGRLVRDNRAPLAFGFLHAFLSSPGQTFFIALVVGSFSVSLGISGAALGTLYLFATLGSACILPLIGHLIDRVDLRLFAGTATVGLGLACLLTASADALIPLAVAIMLLRLTGQGLMVHVEATATARYFGPDRGKALGLTALGLPLGEAVMPLLVTAAIATLGWRETYAGIGLAVLLVFLPLSQMLLIGQPQFNRPVRDIEISSFKSATVGIATLARSRFFWFALPLLLYAPFFGTALLFHIGPLGAAKGWPLSLIAQGFVAYAVGHTMALFVFGPLVDRMTARALLPWMLVPLLLAMVILAAFDHRLALFAFLGLAAVSTGATKTVVSAVWAEVYGPAVIGSVRSAAATLMVAGSAAGPAVLGLGLVAGVPIPMLVAIAVGVGIFAIALFTLGTRLTTGAALPGN
jgi:MFS family permease